LDSEADGDDEDFVADADLDAEADATVDSAAVAELLELLEPLVGDECDELDEPEPEPEPEPLPDEDGLLVLVDGEEEVGGLVVGDGVVLLV
jgi:hypothetical protein